MFKGIYSAASGMIAAERVQEILSHNLANAQTPGFKQDRAAVRSFPEMLLQRLEASPSSRAGRSQPGRGGRLETPIGTLHTGVYMQESIPRFGQGPLQETGRALDVAIVDQYLPPNPETGRRGHLFFAVQAGDGEIRYTRNGQFVLDQDGYLVTPEGYYVLDETLNPIYAGHDRLVISEDGRVLLDPQAAGGAPADVNPEPRLWLGYTEHPERLIRERHGLWRWPGGEGEEPFAEPQLAANVPFLTDPANPGGIPFALKQGFLEQSNVDVTQTMTQMLMHYRLYEANQKVLQTYDRNMELAANQIGKLY
ncbi:flagellar hook-basal body complex protein FlhO [Caldalkalibacillus thermarum]|uniref:flagellar hook-basal body protein n=1 Tax=Caldalkalibacillus thermarum TaxID=296745 RepID=UPI00166A9A39|nr:flagellar hook-basal body protein [Caldalkalibacillus thermarum]GGK25591.1 flagellar hook-basal body complex protein FlhO [Caldalkalibacillus thermarum]